MEKRSISELKAELASREALIDQKAANLNGLIAIEQKLKKENEDADKNLVRQKSVISVEMSKLTSIATSLAIEEKNLKAKIIESEEAAKFKAKTDAAKIDKELKSLDERANYAASLVSASVAAKSLSDKKLAETDKYLNSLKQLEKNLKNTRISLGKTETEISKIKKDLEKKLDEAYQEKTLWIKRKEDVDARDKVVSLMKAGIKKQQEDIATRENSLEIARLRMMKEINDNGIKKTLESYGA